MSTTELVQRFLGHIFAGETEEALALVHPQARFIATRPVTNPHNPLHGTFTGREGAARFFSTFAELFQPGDFAVEAAFGAGDHTALYGTLRHTVRRTGRDFASDWALIAKAEDGKLVLYHFYEDSEALRDAAA